LSLSFAFVNPYFLQEVIVQAQGEMALEVFLQQVREQWEGATFDLINYRGKCSLVRGWDELFQKLTDHINSLAAMRISPYFRVFEAECSSWDDKLNRLFALLDVWIDVQRRWVYLEGIFTGRLEAERTRFLVCADRVTVSRLLSCFPWRRSGFVR
jgi:dynein heavy chain 1